MIDGANGEIGWIMEAGMNQFSPGICVDLNKDGVDEIIFVENKLVDQETFTMGNQLRVFDIKNDSSYYLGAERNGICLASTPTIGDLDSDGHFEIVTITAELDQRFNSKFCEMQLTPIKAKPERITWPGYLGPLENGILLQLK